MFSTPRIKEKQDFVFTGWYFFFFQFKALNKKMAVQMKHDSDTFSLDFNLKILLVRFILIAAEVMKH